MAVRLSCSMRPLILNWAFPNKELQALDDGSFALFKGEGKPC